MAVGIESEEVAKGLDGDDGAGDEQEERGRCFKVNLLFARLYGSVLGGEGFVAESGGECGGAL